MSTHDLVAKTSAFRVRIKVREPFANFVREPGVREPRTPWFVCSASGGELVRVAGSSRTRSRTASSFVLSSGGTLTNPGFVCFVRPAAFANPGFANSDRSRPPPFATSTVRERFWSRFLSRTQPVANLANFATGREQHFSNDITWHRGFDSRKKSPRISYAT